MHMPYSKISDLPSNVKNPLPTGAQRLWMSVFNSNHSRCTKNGGSSSSCDDVARIAAWGAVKKKYKKGKDGKWAPKKSK
jgi:cation transport regulator